MHDDGPREDFERFVAGARPGLLRTAALLTGDRADAEELVQRALGRVRRSGRRGGDPLVVARRALVRGVSGWRGRLRPGGQVIESLPDPFAPAPPAAEPALAGALRDLPVRTRAAVVLSTLDGLDAEALAPVLGTTVAEAGAAAASGTATLRAALTPDPFRREQPADPDEQLRAELRRLAAGHASWRLDAEQATADVGHRRTRSRNRLLAGSVAAVLCVGGAAVTVGRPDPAVPATAAAPPASSAPAERPPAVPAVPVLVGPTRGTLAGDPAFLDAVRQVGWGPLEAPPPDERTVVLATDTPDGRAVLVVGTVAEDFRGMWLTGPVGADAGALVPHLPPQLGERRPVTLLLGGPGPATLVVVAARGDTIEVSERLMTGPRGTVGRTWAPAEDTEGVAVVPARTTEDGPALSVRVRRDGQVVHRSAVDWPGDRPGRTVPLPALTPLRPSAAPADTRVVDAALVGLAVPLGTEPAALQPELLWAAPLPLSSGPGTVAVVAARSPGGALVVTTWAGGGGAAVPCGTQTPPGTTELASVTVARVCSLELPGLAATRDGVWLVVTAPPAAASAELLDAAGEVLAPLPLTAGGAVTALPDGARTVRTLDAAGDALVETPIAPRAPEPFGDFGPGPVG